MTRFLPKLAISATALLFTVAVAGAQTAPQAPPAATPKPAAAAPKTGQKKASTPEGIECSNQADAKNLHGKERRKFRAKCISDLKKAKAPPKAEPAKKS